MVRIPKWKSHLRIETLAPDLVFVLSERGNFVLKGRPYFLVAPLINGRNSITDIAEQIDDLPFFQAYYAVNRIFDKGYLAEADASLPAEIEALCHALDFDATKGAAHLRQKSVYVHAIGDASGTPLRQALVNTHVRVVDNPQDAQLCLVVTPDYLHPDVATLHERCVREGKSWMLLKIDGTIPWIGPLFESDLSKCWACLSQRLRLHRRLEKTISIQRSTKGYFPPPAISASVLTQMAAGMAATEVVKWILQGGNEVLTEHVITIDTKTMEMEKHLFVKRPQCAVCGDPGIVARRTRQPLVLQPQKKLFTSDGGHRTTTPDVTVARFEHHVSRITGVVAGLMKRNGHLGNGLIHTYASGVNIQYDSNTYETLRSLYRGGDGGKGATSIQSKASGLCEAIERYSGSFHGDEYRVRASYEELGENAIHPYTCLNFSDKQYADATAVNRVTKTSIYNRVRPRFSETEAIDWTPVWSLTHQTFKYLPTAYLYFGTFREGPSATPACSNGLAAGNTLEEAILQGFMELVERDGVSLWWYNRLRRPAVDLNSFANSYINQLQEYYCSIGRELWALDLTSDLGIPTFAAISRRMNGPREDLIFGFGAHFDPKIALLRALTEANQTLSAFLVTEGDAIPEFNEEATEWWETATLENQPYLAPDPMARPRSYGSFPHQWSHDIKDDVEQCVEIAREQGLETLVLDQTQPDVGLNVVKVIVPGLRHFWRRLGPGRLYDIPVKMGWLDRPHREEELNPYSVFI